ncbi:MAG: hypothetical protein WAZ18_04080 [Alphaproteobacteria bacterium]
MDHYTITNKQSIAAVWLAYRLRGADPRLITRVLSETGCPRGLFILASILQAATAPGAIINERA